MNKDRPSNAEELLKSGAEAAVLTKGTSMRPMLREHKDVVIIEPVKRELKVGDVPLYRRRPDEPLILHRILKITPEHYIIRGDNTYENEYVEPSQIVGVLKAFYRNGKYRNCETDKGYRMYVFLNRISYPVRYIYKTKIIPFAVRLKHPVKEK